MTYLNRCLQTIPGRDIQSAPIDRRAFLRRYLAERADQSWTAEYKARAIELTNLEGK